MLEPLPVLVGRLPPGKRTARIRRTLGRALSEHGYVSVRFADAMADDGLGMDDILPHIGSSFICLFDMSKRDAWAPLLELGYALGKGRYCIVFQKKRSGVLPVMGQRPSIRYGTVDELVEKIVDIFPECVGAALRHYALTRDLAEGVEDFANIDPKLISSLGSVFLEDDPIDEFAAESECGLSAEQTRMTMAVLTGMGLVEEKDTLFRVTEFGRMTLPSLLEGISPGSQ